MQQQRSAVGTSSQFLEPTRPSNLLKEAFGSRASSGGQRHSRKPVGWATKDARTQERIDRLTREFENIDANHDRNLSFQEVCDFLDGKSEQPFDRQLLRDLFAKMDRNHDDNVSMEEFIDAYVDAEEQIRKRIDELQTSLKESNKKKVETERSLLEARATEKINQYGIMKGSVLTVTAIEAQDLKPMDLGNRSDPYVIFHCQQQRIETRYISGTLNPVWNEAFTFEINNGNDELKVVVMDHDTLGQDDFEGQVSIRLDSLRDQMRHERFYSLTGKNGEKEWQGRIRLRLQWIWSRLKYLEDVLSQWTDNIEADREELDFLETQLRQLEKPFGIVNVGAALQERYGVEGMVDLEKAERIVEKAELKVNQKVDQLAAQFMPEGVPVNWQNFNVGACILLAVLSTLSCFERPDFVNLTIALTGWALLITGRITASHCRWLSGAVCVSQLYDLVWFFCFMYHWVIGQARDEGIEDNIRRFTCLVSLINFIYKFVVLGLFVKLSYEMKQANTASPPVQKNSPTSQTGFTSQFASGLQ